jgi:hypothetical protein
LKMGLAAALALALLLGAAACGENNPAEDTAQAGDTDNSASESPALPNAGVTEIPIGAEEVTPPTGESAPESTAPPQGTDGSSETDWDCEATENPLIGTSYGTYKELADAVDAYLLECEPNSRRGYSSALAMKVFRETDKGTALIWYHISHNEDGTYWKIESVE